MGFSLDFVLRVMPTLAFEHSPMQCTHTPAHQAINHISKLVRSPYCNEFQFDNKIIFLCDELILNVLYYEELSKMICFGEISINWSSLKYMPLQLYKIAMLR